MSFLGESSNVTSLTDIATNSANIAINTANIAAIDTSVAINAANIAAIDTSGISTNTVNIATNAADIDALEAKTAKMTYDQFDDFTFECDTFFVKRKGAANILTVDVWETADDNGASLITGTSHNSLFIRAGGNTEVSGKTYGEGLILMGSTNNPRVADESHVFIDLNGNTLIGDDRKDLPIGSTDKLKVMGNTHVEGDLTVGPSSTQLSVEPNNTASAFDDGATVITGRAGGSTFIRADGNGQAVQGNVTKAFGEGLVLSGSTTNNDPHLTIDRSGNVLISNDRGDLPDVLFDPLVPKFKVTGDAYISGDLTLLGDLKDAAGGNRLAGGGGGGGGGAVDNVVTSVSLTKQEIIFGNSHNVDITGFSLDVGTYLITGNFLLTIGDPPYIPAHGSPLPNLYLADYVHQIKWGTPTNATKINDGPYNALYLINRSNQTYPSQGTGGAMSPLILQVTSAGAYPQITYSIAGSQGGATGNDRAFYHIYLNAIKLTA